MFRDFKTNRPESGTRILAFSPVYPPGDPMRFRMVTVLPVPMDEITAYALESDMETSVWIVGIPGAFDAPQSSAEATCTRKGDCDCGTPNICCDFYVKPGSA